MIKTIQQLMQKPHAHELAVRELNDAKRELLASQTGRDYAEAMCKYHEARIARLESMLLEAATETFVKS